MSDSPTVILTSERPDLLAAIANGVADAQAIVVGPNPCVARMDQPVLCFVDWLLPEISGLEMCRRLREFPATAHSHISIVLDEDDADSRRRALKAGADDYLPGPLTPDLLLSRIRAYSRHAHSSQHGAALAHGELTLDLVAHQVRWRKRQIALMPNQFRLLAHFIEHPNQVFTRGSLLAVLGKDDHAIDERTVDVWVGRLRRALREQGAPDPLRTVRSMGYVLDRIEPAR